MTEKKPIKVEIKDSKLIIEDEEISIEKLHSFLCVWGIADVIEEINKLVFSLAQIGLMASEVEITPEQLRYSVPTGDSIYFLKELSNLFKKVS